MTKLSQSLHQQVRHVQSGVDVQYPQRTQSIPTHEVALAAKEARLRASREYLATMARSGGVNRR